MNHVRLMPLCFCPVCAEPMVVGPLEAPDYTECAASCLRCAQSVLVPASPLMGRETFYRNPLASERRH